MNELYTVPAPTKEQIISTLGIYQIIKSIGKGGMGEVFFSYDPLYGRYIALKRIREDLKGNQTIINRFIKEARITSQLTHPAIIPIYAIHDENEMAYYTMPFVEGETLKQILIRTKKQQQKKEALDHIGSSIPALIRIFLSVCQAIAYAHSKQVLHRDLKPENIIIGKFGEAFILDWGLAQLMDGNAENDENDENNAKEKEPAAAHSSHTGLGKVVGTIAYMAPERCLGRAATVQTDIYALGVILYQILTLRMPFHRKNLKEFRKTAYKEKYLTPTQAAPYRDIPPLLTHVATKCLAAKAKKRYSTVNEVIHDLENYLEGRSEWLHVAHLDITDKRDWEFQEHVFLGEHMAITRHPETPDWVNLMISKLSFSGNTKLQAKVRLRERCHGIGFLLNIPEASERTHLSEGYCLWLSSDRFRSTRFLRSSAEVMRLPDLFLNREEWYDICIEKVENNIHFFINGVLQYSYIGFMPLRGTHIGVLARDADFALCDFNIFVGNTNLTVSCLAIPDAFLAHRSYGCALSEYRRIAYSFPGRIEGREALFRAGITLLEKARSCQKPDEKQLLLDESLTEFSRLRTTPGAPLEYVGKTLVYQAMRDYKEEVKCFELGLRRYPNHPLLSVLNDHLIYRMHEAARSQRKAAYNFILLALRHIPHSIEQSPAHKLFHHLYKHCERLPFLQLPQSYPALVDNPACLASFATTLAFWLKKNHILKEIIEALLKEEPSEEVHLAICDALFALFELDETDYIQKFIEEEKLPLSHLEQLSFCLKAKNRALCEVLPEIFSLEPPASFSAWRTAIHFIEKGFDHLETALLLPFLESLHLKEGEGRYKKEIACWLLKAYIIEKNKEKALEILQNFELEELTHEDSLLYFLYGCYLEIAEGHDIAMVHFAGVLDNPYPRSWMLGCHFIIGKLNEKRGWPGKAFYWEKRQLARQLALFYRCSNQDALSEKWRKRSAASHT